ncbi:sugar ABC transporter ATP-binding protein [Maliponia aquimaris]|uniref:Ribose import ATP-binding protein RbsA n=1 Tax=Maliponia aquimaris TaxID=1673631 RepID=A0A238KY92_9RHOB|nr:sugar ABC transporter ATP-binding protein [Maliponia aquimaris]SMX47814.1 Ribose import ATP-binding protein RbsA [Maliponia aquimaris]
MPPLLELAGATKRFGPTLALAGVDFDLERGEVHALLGENGAGKSTALGLMYGVTTPDEGEVRIGGTPVHLGSIAQAQAQGVSCVFQELSLAEGLSVAENIFAGRAPQRGGWIDWTRLRREARTLLDDFEMTIDVRARVGDLPVGARQVVEIAKALSLDAKILLLDEPTSALAPDEKQALFRLIRRLTARGLGVVYVSHHLSEVLDIADRITVFRDGRRVSCRNAAETTEAEIVEDMVGRKLGETASGPARIPGAEIARLEGVHLTGRLDGIDLALRQGEIVGLAGLLGSGAPDIGEVLAGLARPTVGTITLDGHSHSPRGFRAALARGVGFVPQDRKTEGLFLDMSLRGNLIAAALPAHSRLGLLSTARARATSDRAIRDFSIRTPDDRPAMASLSGGNQQKVMLAKWLATGPRLLVVNEPTKGVDIRSKRQIHDSLRSAAEAGVSVLVISSDFPELIEISDRVLVVRKGRIAGALGKGTEAELIALASGAAETTNTEAVQ